MVDDVSVTDVRDALFNDPMFKRILDAVPDDQRDRIRELATEFAEGWQSGVIEKVTALMSDEGFVSALMSTSMRREDPQDG